MSLIKQARKSIVTRDTARSTAKKANAEVEKLLQEALLLARTAADSMEIYRLTDDSNLMKTALRKAVTLLGTSTKCLWDLAVIRENYFQYSSDAEFRKKEEIILSKITVEWLMSLEKTIPHQYCFELRRSFGAELRRRFEQEAKAATSQAEYVLVYEYYQNLPVDTSGFWGESGWQPQKSSGHSVPFSYTG